MSKEFFPPRPGSQPTIYTYENTNPQYTGLLKVGYATVDVQTRVSQQYPTRWWYTAIILFLLLLTNTADAGVGFSGYLENDLFGPGSSTAVGDMLRLRLKADADMGDKILFHLEPLIKDGNTPDDNHLVWDKYYLKACLPSFSITVGKQRIAWGSGYIWNPTDTFNPFILSFAVREEETSSVKAIRAEIPLGNSSGLDCFLTDDRVGLRAKTNMGKFDLSASCVDQPQVDPLPGFDFAGEVYGVGVRGEAAFKDDWQCVLGGDYTLENGVGLNLEYYHNGTSQQVFLGANKLIDEITQIRTSLIVNLNNRGIILYPQYTRNIRQNLDFSLEAMFSNGEYNPAPAQDGLRKMILVKLILHLG